MLSAPSAVKGYLMLLFLHRLCKRVLVTSVADCETPECPNLSTTTASSDFGFCSVFLFDKRSKRLSYRVV